MEKGKTLPQIEKELLSFWDKNKVFEKSLKKNKKNRVYSFYDGPPFASGSPHYGHIMVSFVKDIVRRYWTLRGFNVEQTFGWDCHGLPVELYVEKKIGIKTKKDILKLEKDEYASIEKFNKICRNSVFDCIDEWYQMFKRIGRWGDFKSAYATMDNDYMESVWWVFKQLWEKKLIYQGYKSMHICPRCETPLSNFEVSLGYKDVTEISVYAKFKLIEGDYKDAFMLAWTTTPWTLPANMFLALNKNVKYRIVESEGEKYILADARIKDVFKERLYKIISDVKAKDLENVHYEPLFPYFADRIDCFQVVLADFVNIEDGTGIVHIASAFGEDDLNIAIREKVEPISNVKIDGTFTDEVKEWAGKFVKNEDLSIKDYLDKKGKLFYFENYTHSYPYCWRCDTPLINYSTKAWLVRVSDIKNNLIKNNKKINWVPEHIKEGRFGDWLENVRDWVISRNRFWGAPIPVWVCGNCKNIKVIGAIKELEKLSGKKVEDLHRPFVDKLTLKCEKCKGVMERTKEVLDCWFESGSMPYAQYHYPFENKEKFKKTFPADFIAESLDQTRCWFYNLHVLSTALYDKEAFKNVIVNGLILDAEGKKLSKKLKNYPDPNFVFEKYGADALRYFIIKNTIPGENCRLNEDLLKESQKELVFPILNSINFFKIVSESGNFTKTNKNILDKWLEAKLEMLVSDVNKNMENYDLRRSLQFITEFVNNDLNNWYIKLSRDRLKFKEGSVVLGRALLDLSIISAPFLPFISEYIYQNLKETPLKKYYKFKLSVFLENVRGLTRTTRGLTQKKIIEETNLARRIISLGWRIRKENNLPLRLPLYFIYINTKIKKDYFNLIKDALNVKDILFEKRKDEDLKYLKEENVEVGLTTKIDEFLINEKIIREFIRNINNLRKEAGLTIKDKVKIQIHCDKNLKKLLEKNIKTISAKTFSTEIIFTPKTINESNSIFIENNKIEMKPLK